MNMRKRLERASRGILSRLTRANSASQQSLQVDSCERWDAPAVHQRSLVHATCEAFFTQCCITSRISSTPALASQAETGSPRVGSMRMSTGPSARKLKPAPGSSSCAMKHRGRRARRGKVDRAK